MEKFVWGKNKHGMPLENKSDVEVKTLHHPQMF